MELSLARISLLVASCLFVSATADDKTSSGPVALQPGKIIDLNDQNFNATLETAQYLFIDFMTRSCGVCTRLKPELEEAAAVVLAQAEGGMANGEDSSVLSSVQFARVNVNKQDELALRFGIQATPTFLLISGGKLGASKKFSIQQQPTSGGFVSEIRTSLGLAPVSRVKVIPDSWSTTDLFGWVFWRGSSTGKLATTLLYFTPSAEKTEAGSPGSQRALAIENALHEVSQVLADDPVTREIRIAFVPDSPGLRKAFQVEDSQEPHAVLYRDHDDPKKLVVPLDVLASGETTVAALVDWIRLQDVPIVEATDDVGVRRFKARKGLDLAFLFLQEDAVEIAPARNKVVEQMHEKVAAWEEEGLVARGQISFLLVNGQKFAGWSKAFGLEPMVLPAIGFHERGGQEEWGAAFKPTPESEAKDHIHGVQAEGARLWDKDETEAYRRHMRLLAEEKASAELDELVAKGLATPTPKPTPKPFGHVPEVPPTASVVMPFAEIEAMLRKRQERLRNTSGGRSEEL